MFHRLLHCNSHNADYLPDDTPDLGLGEEAEDSRATPSTPPHDKSGKRNAPRRPPAGVTPKKRQPKKSSDAAPLIWLALAVIGGTVGVLLYWKEMKIAAVLAAGWFFVVAIMCLARGVYILLVRFSMRVLRLRPKTARMIFLPAVLIFAGTSIWRMAPFMPVVDSMINEAVSGKLSAHSPHFIYTDSAGEEVFSEGARLVSANEVWESLLGPAIIVTEDERHLDRDIPIDPWAVGRAIYRNATKNGREGASTIQIQIVDLLFDDLKNEWLNKVFEWALTMRLYARMPDHAVQLAVYCNLVPGTNRFRGAAALAADLYNVSDLRQLTPAQAASIAASLKGSDYNPRHNPAKARQRRNVVLSKMRAGGYLTDEQFQEASNSGLGVVGHLKPQELFVRAAREENSGFLARVAGLGEGGTIEAVNAGRNVTPVLRVELTLDRGVQQIAERQIADEVRGRIRQGLLPQGTDVAFIVVENRTGNVIAVVPALEGELDLTRATVRDLGSTGKPLLAASVLTVHVVSADETFANAAPMRFGGEFINNYGDHYTDRALSLVECIERSSNVCFMQVQQRRRAEDWRAQFAALNLPQPRTFNKIGIGDNWPVPVLRLASAYTALPNGGEMVMPRYISAVAEADGRGRIVSPTERRRVFDPASCRIVIEGMRACLKTGTGSAAAAVADVAWGKTGTTSDSLAVIQTQSITAVVWIGARDTNRDLKITGGALAMKLLAGFVRRLRRSRPELVAANSNAV